MAYYKVCPDCGSNLDPGEKCDCEAEKIRKQKSDNAYYRQHLRADEKGGQLAFAFEYRKGGGIGA